MSRTDRHERPVFARPLRVTTWMALFLALIAGLAALLVPQLEHAFRANVAFNGLILGVLAFGVLVNLRQVWRLQRDVLWVGHFDRIRAGHPPPTQPVLLAPLARMLANQPDERPRLSPEVTRGVLDGVQIGLDEQRDLSRYVIGLRVFLGLLGTFWGLLATIRSVGEIIGSMSSGGDAAAMFEALKHKLDAPLSGMATSFSTSLFGLAGSLIVGFLDLQAGHAQNRFYNDLENWLASLTHLGRAPTAALAGFDGGSFGAPAYVEALLEQTAETLERMQRVLGEATRERQAGSEQLARLTQQISRLGELMAQQLATQDELARRLPHLARPAATDGLQDELRNELRLLSRTLAAALNRRPGA